MFSMHLTAKKEGFFTNRLNSLRDITANFLQEVTNDVQIETTLEPRTREVFNNLTNSTGNAKVDITTQRVWIRVQQTST